MHVRSLLLLFLAGLAACATTAPSSVRKLDRLPHISLANLTSITQILSSDAFEGRAPTTAGEEKTVRLIAERFQQAGLQPGNQGGWFQNVPLVEIATDPSALTIGGGKKPLRFTHRKDFVANSYQIKSRIALENSDIVFVGYGINAPERGWNDYAGTDVRGKTVIILVNDPDYQMPGLNGPFGGRAMTYYGRWTYKYEEAARQGAAAAFIIHDTEPAAYGWNVVQSSWTGPQYGMDAANNHMDQSKVIGWLTNEAGRRLLANSGQDLDLLAAAAKRKGFRAVALSGKASLSLSNRIKRQNSRNVIGILPGTDRPDEYVLYTAHWDHLGRCDPAPDGDDICNGAIDNATGVAALVALAEAHARAGRPRRTILFLAVTAEESGLLGAQYYAENPIFPLRRTVGGVNMDGLSMAGRSRNMVIVGGGKSELEAFVERAVAAQNRITIPEPAPEKGFYYRSDHFAFARKGVPMAYFEAGTDLVMGGKAAGAADADDYLNHRYHGPKDEYDPNWDWSGALQDVELYYRVGRELAEGKSWPNWYSDAEFRAVRERDREAGGQ